MPRRLGLAPPVVEDVSPDGDRGESEEERESVKPEANRALDFGRRSLRQRPLGRRASTLNAGQEGLAAAMQAAWANFAARGDPSSAALPWPSFNGVGQVLSLVQPQSQVDTENAARHHCAFWSAG